MNILEVIRFCLFDHLEKGRHILTVPLPDDPVTDRLEFIEGHRALHWSRGRPARESVLVSKMLIGSRRNVLVDYRQRDNLSDNRLGFRIEQINNELKGIQKF